MVIITTRGIIIVMGCIQNDYRMNVNDDVKMAVVAYFKYTDRFSGIPNTTFGNRTVFMVPPAVYIFSECAINIFMRANCVIFLTIVPTSR